MTHDVELITRAGCHLCEDARRVVRVICGHAGIPWREVDVDAAGPDAVAAFGELVPVLRVDGVLVDHWRVDPARLRAALA